VLTLAVIGAIVAYVVRRRSKRAAEEEIRRRSLDAYTKAVALHDQAAVLPMSAEVDRARMMSAVVATLDTVIGEFDALAAEPTSGDASTEIGDVQLALGNLRGALQAQVQARGIDAELLRERLADLDGALQRFRERISPTTS
jgi:hypothetical protein